MEGEVSRAAFYPLHTQESEHEEVAPPTEEEEELEEEGEAKRRQLIAELLAYREQMGIQF